MGGLGPTLGTLNWSIWLKPVEAGYNVEQVHFYDKIPAITTDCIKKLGTILEIERIMT